MGWPVILIIAVVVCVLVAVVYLVLRRRSKATPADTRPRFGMTSRGGISVEEKVVVKDEGGIQIDENVQFTVYRPKAVRPEEWYPFLAYSHLGERRPDAKEWEPDPLEEVKRDADVKLGAKAAGYEKIIRDREYEVPKGGEIRFVPEIEGIEFDPPEYRFFWQKPVHCAEFHMRASSEFDGKTAGGCLSVYLGLFLIAEVDLKIRVDSKHVDDPKSTPHEVDFAKRYRRIFPSYSHKDKAIVEAIEGHVSALGDEYTRDVTHLRSGELWNDRIKEMIEDADIFQLFWSSNSMHSPYVRQEWEYALSLGRPLFVRPVYWEEPLPECEEPRLPPEDLRKLHFRCMSIKCVAHKPKSIDVSEDGEKDISFPDAPRTTRRLERVLSPPGKFEFLKKEGTMLAWDPSPFLEQEDIANFIINQCKDPVIVDIINKAKDELETLWPDPIFDGYFSGNKSKIFIQVEAIYRVIYRHEPEIVLSIEPQERFAGPRKQFIRNAGEVFKLREADCVDIVCLLASLLIKIGLNPLITAVGPSGSHFPTHVILGYWLIDEVAQETKVQWSVIEPNIANIAFLESTGALRGNKKPFFIASAEALLSLPKDIRRKVTLLPYAKEFEEMFYSGSDAKVYYLVDVRRILEERIQKEEKAKCFGIDHGTTISNVYPAINHVHELIITLRPSLSVKSGDKQQVIKIVGSIITIGRAAENDLVLSHNAISRRHAKVREENGIFYFWDLGSINGSKINQKEVTGKTELKNGDLIEVAGVVEIEFLMPSQELITND